MKLLSTLIIVICAVSVPVNGDFAYTSPTGARWTVTADGLSAIQIGDRQVAAGGWQLESGHEWYGASLPDPATGPVKEKTIEIVSDTVAKVRHVHDSVTAEYTYTFAAEDVQIKAWVTNRHDRAPLEIVHFSGLTVDFGQVPTGWMPLWHGTYTRANPHSAWHPHLCRIGASWGIGGGFGVGMSPGDAFTDPTLTMWEWNWQPHMREKDTRRRLRYFIKANVSPATARTFTLMLRCSPNTDWKHLVAPYKDLFNQWSGNELTYDRADHRPIIQSVVNSAVQYINDANPYGLHGGRRIDTPEGVEEFAAAIIRGASRVNAQGVILWGQGGSDPRGAMYRPDFDVVPPPIEENLPKLAARLKASGLKLGLTARPAEVVQRADWKTDLTTWLAPTENNLTILGNRFKRTLDWGTQLYYLDTFGNRIDDVAIMRSLRRVIGRGVQTYAEHGSDVILPLSGLYTELVWDAQQKQYGFAFLSLQDMQFFRWLCPEVPICARVHFDNPFKAPAAEAEPPIEFLMKHRISPMFGDYHLVHHPEDADRAGTLIRQHLDDSGHWRDNP